MIRRFAWEDSFWVLSLCREMYTDRDIQLGVPWFVDCVRRKDRLVIRSDHGLGVASFYLKYGFIPLGNMDLLAVKPGYPWESLKLLRAMVEWSRNAGAKRFVIGSDTGVDLGPLARRLGGKKADSSYRISF